ncbi:MAG: cell surface protein SprA, partial [Pedobacter sp.]
LKNPLRNQAAPGLDDGLNKSGMAWFNELRLTEFDERGGWAATARMNAKLADFGDLNVSGSKTTIGFGSLEKRVSERSRKDDMFIDVSSSMELGKFFPKKSGIKIPFFVSYSNQTGTPQFDPRTQDVELKNAINNVPKIVRDSILNYAQDRTVRSSFNFTNVRKERTDDKPVRLWDVENFNVSYGSTAFTFKDFIVESNIQRTYRGSLAYNYSAPAKNYQPFSKVIKSNMLSILKDFNFSLRPNSILFRLDADRFYSENNLRNNDPNNYIPINTTFNKNFLITRVYGIGWLLTNSLKMNFDATNYSIIDEPEGRINGLKRDTLWQNLKTLGRTTDYNHSVNIDYTLPINKLPGLDWIDVVTRYGTNFTWQTEPLATLRNPTINLGNTIQNSRVIQINPDLRFSSLYSKFGFIRRSNAPDSKASGFAKAMIKLLTSVQSIGMAYTETRGIFLPGYMPTTNYFGLENATGAPGLGFVFGSQSDSRFRALQNGWLTRDTLQNQLYINTLLEDLSVTGIMEPVRDLRISLFANRRQNFNFSTNFRY